MNQTGKESAAPHAPGSAVKEGQSFVLGLWGVRYQVKDVSRSVAFYSQQLGFKVDQQNLPAFAQVSVGNLKLILSGPGLLGRARCQMVITKNPADGTAWSFKSPIFLPGSRR